MRKRIAASLLAVVTLGSTLGLTLSAPMANASVTAWASYTQQPTAHAKAVYSYQWYSRNDNHGGFHIYGTLYDLLSGDTNNAKFKIKVEGYAWTTYAVKNTSATIPNLVWYDGAGIITTDATTQTCEGKPLLDTCSQQVWYNPYH